MAQRTRSLPTWGAYERGRTSSSGSLASIAEDNQPSQISPSATSAYRSINTPAREYDGDDDDQHDLTHRRSSVTMRINSLRQMGGVNNIDNFARSWQRAAGFREITPVRRASVASAGGDAEGGLHPETQEATPPNRSLLRQQFEAASASQTAQVGSDVAIQDDRDDTAPDESTNLLLERVLSHREGKSFLEATRRASPYAGSFVGSYGTISTRITDAARQRASILVQEQYEENLRLKQEEPDKAEEPPAIETEEREDGEVIVRRVGESTLPMTVFNSTNVLIGIGLLALPLALKYSGWVVGLFFLTAAALTTQYTAKLLAKCLDTNTANSTYGDLAWAAFGNYGRALVELLFTIELLAANVALIILFSDTIHSLVPALSPLQWKVAISIGLLPLNFAPFKVLSVTSILGIFCCMSILVILIIDGAMKPHAPGSLREVAQTYAFPADWRTLPLSLGLFMAPWGGHGVFPAIYKDMRHPQKYGKALRSIYLFTYGLDVTVAIVGYLMYGDYVRDEVTQNILLSEAKAYPHVLSVMLVVLISTIPITKLPLSNRPVMDTFNKKLGIDTRQMEPKARAVSERSMNHKFLRAIIGIACNIIELGVAILIPSFDSIMALMGSALCFTICIILPVAFHLRIFAWDQIGLAERMFDWFLIVICSVLAVIGVVFAVAKDSIIAPR